MEIQCNIFLDREAKEYYPCETVSGRVVIVSENRRSLKGIRLRFDGKCEVHFSELKNRMFRGERNEVICQKRMKNSCSKELHLESVLSLIENDEEVIIDPGQKEFAFQYDLPGDLPASFNGAFGKIIYTITLELPIIWGPALETTTEFYILSTQDLATVREAQLERQSVRRSRSFGCYGFGCCCGTVNFVMSLENSGTYVGDYIPFVLEINNDSDQTMATRISLVQRVLFRSRKKARAASKSIHVIDGPAVVPGDFDIWAGNILQVPPCVPTSLGHVCKLIDVKYELQVAMFINGIPVLQGEIPIVIGVRAGYDSGRMNLSTSELPPSYEMALIGEGSMEPLMNSVSETSTDSLPPPYSL